MDSSNSGVSAVPRKAGRSRRQVRPSSVGPTPRFPLSRVEPTLRFGPTRFASYSEPGPLRSSSPVRYHGPNTTGNRPRRFRCSVVPTPEKLSGCLSPGKVVRASQPRKSCPGVSAPEKLSGCLDPEESPGTPQSRRVTRYFPLSKSHPALPSPEFPSISAVRWTFVCERHRKRRGSRSWCQSSEQRKYRCPPSQISRPGQRKLWCGSIRGKHDGRAERGRRADSSVGTAG